MGIAELVPEILGFETGTVGSLEQVTTGDGPEHEEMRRPWLVGAPDLEIVSDRC